MENRPVSEQPSHDIYLVFPKTLIQDGPSVTGFTGKFSIRVP